MAPAPRRPELSNVLGPAVFGCLALSTSVLDSS